MSVSEHCHCISDTSDGFACVFFFFCYAVKALNWPTHFHTHTPPALPLFPSKRVLTVKLLSLEKHQINHSQRSLWVFLCLYCVLWCTLQHIFIYLSNSFSESPLPSPAVLKLWFDPPPSSHLCLRAEGRAPSTFLEWICKCNIPEQDMWQISYLLPHNTNTLLSISDRLFTIHSCC